MKTINILLLSLIVTNLFSQVIPEKEVKTDVNEVTVFLEGAQVVRNATDTLEISLGRDKKVSVNREKVKDFITK